MWKFSLMFLLSIAIGVQCVDVYVTTKFGRIRGNEGVTSEKQIVNTFLKIPYAKPPVNQLRFKNPELWTEKWNGTRYSGESGPPCIQIDYNGLITGKEDCLYLNIFASPVKSAEKKLPVMVFIRGGSFNMGSTDSTFFSPSYLLNHEIVLVTFNYRLNILGFHSTGDDVSPGNYGLKDMVAVLKWVKENIAAFGGDPNSVTLFGNSAGAAAIHHLALSEKTRGLFHKMITMSGTALAPWAFHSRQNIKNDSFHIAVLAGCFNVNGTKYDPNIHKNVTLDPELHKNDGMNDTDRVNCLREKKAEDLLPLTKKLAVWENSPNCIFGPTLENEANDAVITSTPRKMIKDGKFEDIPWINGVTADEGLGLASYNKDKLSEVKQNFTKLAPYLLEYQQVVDEKKHANFSKSLIDYYFQGNITVNFEKNITQLSGDAGIYWPVYEALQKQIKNTKLYFYHFAYQGTYSVTLGDGKNQKSGVAHMDDLNYLFPFLNTYFENLNKTNSESDNVMIKTMTKLWTTFAETGKPSANLTEEWEPYHVNHKFMRLGNGTSTNISMQVDFLSKRMNFWELLMNNASDTTQEETTTGKGGVSFVTDNKYVVFSSLLFFLMAYHF